MNQIDGKLDISRIDKKSTISKSRVSSINNDKNLKILNNKQQ